MPKPDLLWYTAAGETCSPCSLPSFSSSVSLSPIWIFLAVDWPWSVVPPEESPCCSVCIGPLPLVCCLLSNHDKFAFFSHFPPVRAVNGESRKQRSTHKNSMAPIKAEWDYFHNSLWWGSCVFVERYFLSCELAANKLGPIWILDY